MSMENRRIRRLGVWLMLAAGGVLLCTMLAVLLNEGISLSTGLLLSLSVIVLAICGFVLRRTG